MKSSVALVDEELALAAPRPTPTLVSGLGA
jgi:hypothetical protein